MTTHGASAISLGYLYQTQWALVELIRGANLRRTQALTIELHDDVAWGDGASPVELLQLKHHGKINAAGQLTDMSTDLWKTIKVWLDSPKARDDEGPLLTLVTTSSVADGSATALLTPENRDIRRAKLLLDIAARDSTSKATSMARREWLEAADGERQSMVNRMFVLSGSIHIEKIDQAVRAALGVVIPLNHEEEFLGLVWRWWNGVSIDLLRKKRQSITGIDAHQDIEQIRNGFSDDNLPTLVFDDQFDREELIEIHDSHDFVHQLRWVGVGSRNLQAAIVDYYMAVSQETEWLDKHLVDVAELQRFESKVVDEWDRSYGDMLDDLDITSDEMVKAKAGRYLFQKLRDSPLKIRTHYTEMFHSRGKRHMLADDHRIGWHPEFEGRLAQLLLERKQ